MVGYAGKPKPTWQALEYMARVKSLPCCVCLPDEQSMPTQCHHITDGGRRLGDHFCLPLCPKHHENVHLLRSGAERVLWEQVNKTLGIKHEWVQTKIVPRR